MAAGFVSVGGVIVLLGAAVVFTLAVAVFYRAKARRLARELDEARTSRQSLASTYGRITEQFAPFMNGYPFEPRNFRFLGAPVDGVQFEEDRIVFVEFKSNRSQLTPGEARIKRLVEERKVEWFEFRAKEAGVPAHFRRG